MRQRMEQVQPHTATGLSSYFFSELAPTSPRVDFALRPGAYGGLMSILQWRTRRYRPQVEPEGIPVETAQRPAGHPATYHMAYGAHGQHGLGHSGGRTVRRKLLHCNSDRVVGQHCLHLARGCMVKGRPQQPVLPAVRVARDVGPLPWHCYTEDNLAHRPGQRWTCWAASEPAAQCRRGRDIIVG